MSRASKRNQNRIAHIAILLLAIQTFSCALSGTNDVTTLSENAKNDANQKNNEEKAPDPRPEKWAKPLEKDGLPNLARISPALYRGAQPTAEGMKTLDRMGVKTIINLRSFHSDRKLIKDTRLDYIHIAMKTWNPKHQELVLFLKTVADKSKRPIFIHCQHGADRTGLLCATARVVLQGWSAEEALREMRHGGFGYHDVWINLPPYLISLDIERLRREAGIPAPDAAPHADACNPPAPVL